MRELYDLTYSVNPPTPMRIQRIYGEDALKKPISIINSMGATMPTNSSRQLPLLRSLTSTGLLSALALLTSACATKPPQDISMQLERTQTTISQAEKAGALQSALPELQVAKDKLAGAQQALTVKDYDKARDIAKQGQVDAEFALAKAQAAEAQHAAKEAAESNSTLREETKHSADSTDGS